uniref:Uncharacterized protein n=1 Tax=Hofstenia miamia TaxID=442651 RepID=A0A5P8I4M4_HOFMI|nr:hypothetical protein [Hofstenia miamia]
MVQKSVAFSMSYMNITSIEYQSTQKDLQKSLETVIKEEANNFIKNVDMTLLRYRPSFRDITASLRGVLKVQNGYKYSDLEELFKSHYNSSTVNILQATGECNFCDENAFCSNNAKCQCREEYRDITKHSKGYNCIYSCFGNDCEVSDYCVASNHSYFCTPILSVRKDKVESFAVLTVACCGFIMSAVFFIACSIKLVSRDRKPINFNMREGKKINFRMRAQSSYSIDTKYANEFDMDDFQIDDITEEDLKPEKHNPLCVTNPLYVSDNAIIQPRQSVDLCLSKKPIQGKDLSGRLMKKSKFKKRTLTWRNTLRKTFGGK